MKTMNLLMTSYLFFSLALTACNGDSAEGIAETQTEVVSSTTDVKKIVSAGVGINFNNLTGGSIEMAINPTTHLPAILYYDRTQQIVPGAPVGALKYAYMDLTGSWNIEVIDGNYGTGTCGSATAFCIGAQNIASANYPQIYDMEFIPAAGNVAAYPMVIYAHGNSAATGKRVRAATRNASTGVWVIEDAVPASSIPAGIAVAGIEYPIKGINITVDGSGRPHVYFGLYETTLINSRLKYVMKTGGAWTTITNVLPAGYNFVAGPPTIGPGTGITQAEAVICPTSDMAILSYGATDNAPAGSVQPWIIRCTAVNASGTCTTWSGLDMITGCAGLCLTGTAMTATTTNAGARSTLAIDPTGEKLIYGMFSTIVPTTQTVVGVQAGADSCSSFSTTAWTTQAHGSANQGVNGFRLAASEANAVNGSAQQVLMLSTTATGAITQLHKTTLSPFTGTWSAANTVSVETAAASFAGALKFDDSTFTAWGAYSVTTGGTAGTVGNDIKVFNAYESDVVSTGYVGHNFVDQTLGIFPSTAAPVMDAGKAPNGTVGYAYFFTELGGAPGPNSHLYYGIKGGTSTSPAFGEKIVYNSTQGATTLLIGQQPSLAYDSNSNPVIAFQDASVGTQGLLMLARSSNQGVSFSVERVDGATTGNLVGAFSSVDVHSSDTIGISYFDATNNNLKFAKRSPTGSWRRMAVDGPTGSCATGSSAGSYSRLRWTAAGKPVIVYQATVAAVKYLRMAIGTPDSNALNYTWSCVTLDSTGQAANARGEGIDFVLNSNEKPIIAHQDSTAARVRFVTCGNDVATCMTTGSSAFTGEIVESVGSVVANSSRPAVTVDSSNKIYVAYYSAADFGLYMKSKSAHSTTSFQYLAAETIETPIEGSLYTNPAGQCGKIMINSSNNPMMFYRSYENWLKFFSREAN